MTSSREVRALEARYIALCLLFGACFGIRFTTDIWVFGRLFDAPGLRFAYVSLGFFGMLCGELLAPSLARRGRFRTAIRLCAAVLSAWSFGMIAVMETGARPLMFVGCVAFGIGFGLFHSLVDSWIDIAIRSARGRDAGDGLLTFGYGMYNLGFLVTSAFAFPMLYSFNWSADLDDPAIAGVMSEIPFVVSLVIIAAIVFASPRDITATAPSPSEGIRSVSLLRYLRSGGPPLWFAIVLGSGVSVLIQYVDHFAPSDLVRGPSVAKRALSIAVLNAIITLSVTLLGGVLLKRYPLKNLPSKIRALLLASALIAVMLLMAGTAMVLSVANELLIAASIGLTEAILLLLPSIIKAIVIERSSSGTQTTAVSLLGAGKRMAAIICSLVLYVVEPPEQSGGVYIVLLFVAIGCLGAALASTLVKPASPREISE